MLRFGDAKTAMIAEQEMTTGTMSVAMKPKLRLVSVRLSQDEYDRLRALSRQWAGGSVSGLIRASMHGILMNGNKKLIEFLSESFSSDSAADLAAQISTLQVLEQRLDKLDRDIRRLEGSAGNA